MEKRKGKEESKNRKKRNSSEQEKRGEGGGWVGGIKKDRINELAVERRDNKTGSFGGAVFPWTRQRRPLLSHAVFFHRILRTVFKQTTTAFLSPIFPRQIR